MEITKKEFDEKATKLIEENNELGLVVLCVCSRKKVTSEESRATQMENLKRFVNRNFYVGRISDIWTYIRQN